MSQASLIVAAVAIGVSLSVQPPINAVMARVLGGALVASTISIAISLLLVAALWATWGKATADWSQLSALPWWVVLGGVVGVVFVAGSVVVAPPLGVAFFFVCVVAGQLIGSMAIDQLGAFGLPVKPVDATRLLGVGLVVAGAAIFQSGS